MKDTTILNNLAECNCMLNENKKECNKALQDGTKKSSENEITLSFMDDEKSKNSEAEVSLNLFNKESNDDISKADNNVGESKILASDHKMSCEKGSQESYLDSSKERLGDDIKNTTTATDSTNTKERLENNIEVIATATNLIPQNEDISLQETSKENAPLNDLAEKASKERELDRRVMDILLAIGISANLHGYYFLKDSIKLAISSPVFIGAITKTMYPTIATMHQTTAFRVERAMRHAIDVSYNKGKIPCLNQIFSLDIFSPYDKPTNAEFIALIADKLKQEFCY